MKYTQFLCLALSFASLQGFAYEEKSIDRRIRYLERKQGYDEISGCLEATAQIEFLYWKADIDGTAYATTSITEQTPLGLIGTEIKTRTPHFSYDPGFRLSVGVQSPYDFFDVTFVWTRFVTQGKDEAQGSFVSGSTPSVGDTVISDEIGLIENVISIPNQAGALCTIKTNLLEVELARGIAISYHFFLRPYFGVRAVWNDVNWKINLKRNISLPDVEDQDSTQLNVNTDFDGVGGVIGLQMQWQAPYGFGIDIRGAGSLVWGRMEETTKQEYLFFQQGATTAITEQLNAHRSFFTMKGILELFAGVFWEARFYSKKQEEASVFSKKYPDSSLRLFLGYEFQLWPYFAQKTNTQLTGQRERFNLGFQGITGGVKVVF